MASLHDLIKPGPPRSRALAGLSLAIVPLLILGSALWGAGFLGPEPETEGAALDAPVVTATPAPEYAVVHAPGTSDDADVDAYTPTITVEFPPEPEPEPAPPASRPAGSGSGGSSGGSGSGGSSGGSSSSSSTPDFRAFCPTGANASVGGSSASSMLSAINTERARLGISSLSWSSSLASAAQSWSNSMAAKDDQSPGDPANALAHNPGRPWGGENVGVSYNSGGSSGAQAMTIVHGAFMKSNGHCENLMNPQWSVVGVGLTQADTGAWYITQNYQ